MKSLADQKGTVSGKSRSVYCEQVWIYLARGCSCRTQDALIPILDISNMNQRMGKLEIYISSEIEKILVDERICSSADFLVLFSQLKDAFPSAVEYEMSKLTNLMEFLRRRRDPLLLLHAMEIFNEIFMRKDAGTILLFERWIDLRTLFVDFHPGHQFPLDSHFGYFLSHKKELKYYSKIVESLSGVV